MWVVGGHGIGDVVERVEAVEVTAHELADALHTSRFEVHGDVDQHERCGDGSRPVGLGDRHERAEPAERRPDERRRRAHPLGDETEVAGEVGEVVVRIGRPAALAVSAEVRRDGEVARLGEPDRRASPRVPCLTSAVGEQHAGRAFAAVGVEHDRDVAALSLDALGGHHGGP